MTENKFSSGGDTAVMYDGYVVAVLRAEAERMVEVNLSRLKQATHEVVQQLFGGIVYYQFSKNIINEVKTQEKRKTAAIAAEDNNTLASLFYYLLPQHTSNEKQGYNYEVQEEKDKDTTGNLGRSDKEDYRYRGGGPSGGGIQTDVLPLCHLSRMARGGGGDTSLVGRATRMEATARAGSTERDGYARGCLLQPSHRRRLSIHRNYDRYQNHSTSEAL